jgi:hypothetical protein
MQSVEFQFSYNSFIKVLMLPMLVGPRYSRVRLDDDRISVRMGLGGWAFAAKVPRSSITEVRRVNGPVLGWGVHGWRGQWLVNGSSKGLVRMTIEPRARGRCLGFPLRIRQLTLSLADPDGFVSKVSPSTR